MEQTTPQPTRPVMDVARPRPVAPVTPRTPTPADKPATQPSSPASPAPAAEPPKPPVDNKPDEAPKPSEAPQALAVHKAPTDEDSEQSSESVPTEQPAQNTTAAAEEQAHQESKISTGPHAPVGVIVVTVLAMVLLSALATMIYFDTQK